MNTRPASSPQAWIMVSAWEDAQPSHLMGI